MLMDVEGDSSATSEVRAAFFGIVAAELSTDDASEPFPFLHVPL
jgi:hypothetical protein